MLLFKADFFLWQPHAFLMGRYPENENEEVVSVKPQFLQICSLFLLHHPTTTHHNPPQPTQLSQSSSPAPRLQVPRLIWSYTRANWKATVTQKSSVKLSTSCFFLSDHSFGFLTLTQVLIFTTLERNSLLNFKMLSRTWFLYIQKFLERRLTDMWTDGHTTLRGRVCLGTQLKYHFHSDNDDKDEKMMTKSEISKYLNKSEWNPIISTTFWLACLAFSWPMCQCETLCYRREEEGKFTELKNMEGKCHVNI